MIRIIDVDGIYEMAVDGSFKKKIASLEEVLAEIVSARNAETLELRGQKQAMRVKPDGEK